MFMNHQKVLSQYKPIIIVVLLFLLVFLLRAEAVNLSSVPSDAKAYYQDNNGLPYFSEMDSYFNYRMTADYLDHGYMGDTNTNGTNWDLHSYYPPGREAAYTPLIVYITAFTYKFLNIFSNIPLTAVAFWIGAFVASLAVIPAYFFIRRITNDYGGITAAILVATAPAYFSHTFAGFFDTDQFNMILPLFTVWFYVESIRADNIKNRTIFAVLSAFSMLLFSLAWDGWIYIFYLLIITTIIYLLVSNYLLNWKTIKKTGEYNSKREWFQEQPGIFALVVFILLSSISILITSGPADFVTSILGPIGFTQLQASVQQTTAYPNVFVSVAELQIPSVWEAINNVGGIIVFIFGLLGVFLLFFRISRVVKAREITEDKKSINVILSGVASIFIGLMILILGILNREHISLGAAIMIIIGTITIIFNKRIGSKFSKGEESDEIRETPKKPQDKKPRKKRKRRKKVKSKKSKEKPVKTEKKYLISELKDKDKMNYLLYAILLSLWLLITAYALTKGVRFAEAFALPVSLAAGIFVGLMLDYVKAYIKGSNLQTVVMIVLVVAAIFAPVGSAYAISANVLPGTDDSMVNSLTWIKDNTSSNTVLTSWWDFGHLFAAVADRPVTFDGGTQNSPRAYWVGKALTTNNESLSVGILKMLSTSGDLGPLTMDNYTNNTGKSVEILNNILGVDKTTALNILTSQYGLTLEQAQKVINYTHPDNPAPDLLITSSDMIGKAGWWSYFGNWNFKTNNSTAYNYVQGEGVIIPNNETGLGNNTTVFIANNAVVAEIIDNNVTAGLVDVNQLQNKNQNISTSELIKQLIAGLQGNNSLVIKPHRLIVIRNNNITQNDIVSNNSIYSIVIVNNNGTYMTYVMNKELEDSMFTKLFILRGQGIRQFTLSYEQPGVMVWKVV